MALPFRDKDVAGRNDSAFTRDEHFKSTSGIIDEELNKEPNVLEPTPRSSSEQKPSFSSNPDDGNDPNIVGWNGPKDPENPINWPSHKRIYHVVIVSIITFIS
jgi:hypothetical protein